MKYCLSYIPLLLLFALQVNAQTTETTDSVVIETINDEVFIGELMYMTADSIFINNEDGLMAFSKTEIKDMQNGVLTRFSGTTNSSVPFYVQTALPNGKGNHYYKNYYLFGNEFNFGLDDNFNLTAGFETATLVFNSAEQLPVLQLGMKYSAKVDDIFHIGFSGKYYFNDNGSVILIDLPLTIGDKRTNFTVAPTFFSSEGDEYIGIFSNLSLALTAKSRFVFDIMRIDDLSLFSINFEFLFKSGFTLTPGVLFNGDGAAPSLSFSIPFGKWKKIYKN